MDVLGGLKNPHFDKLATESSNRWFALGYAALFVSSVLTLLLARSWLWELIADGLMR